MTLDLPEKKIDYGFANGWTETPEQVKKCSHQKRATIIGRCLTQVWCPICGFTYKYDSGD